jgi:serine/threonine-protein kinase
MSMIDRNRWQALSALLDEALALAPPERASWLARQRAHDAALAGELEALLPADDEGSGHQDAHPPCAAATVPGLDAYGQALGAALNPGTALPDAPHPGQRLGSWLLVKKIGEGGMGQVWLASRDDGLYQAQAAIKLLRSDLLASSLAARFARERAVLARLNHPAVARLLDAGVVRSDAGEQAYLVLEYVPGRTLGEHARQFCPLLADRVRLLLRMAQAVEHAHAQLIVHRDLKPSNVIVTPEGEPKLLDFGIAGLLDEGELGDGELTRQTGRGLTLGYAAPEQILGAPIGTAADVFSLGVMLYELISGELPFAPRGTQRLAAERAVLHDEPRRLHTLLGGQPAPHLAAAASAGEADADLGPGLPQDAMRARGDLEAIAAKALRKKPQERYANVGALIDDLQCWLTHRPVSARRDDWQHRTGLWFRRNAVLAGALGVVLLSLSAGLAAATWQWKRAQASARQSDRITGYLSELLSSARPDRHGGEWPTVLQLLENSRATLPKAFLDDPQTRLRLLSVMASTYHELNRFDIAMPMYEELVSLAAAQHSADDPLVLQARIRQANTFHVQGQFDKAIAVLEPMQDDFSRVYGAQSEERRELLYTLSASYSRAGRLDDADRLLTEAGRLTEAAYGRQSPEWMSHQNHLQVLRAAQGRLRDALAAILSTEPFWADKRPENAREILAYRRNAIAMQIRLSEYEGLEPRIQSLLPEMDKLMGAGNDLSAGFRHELARLLTETDQLARALTQREENLARAQAAGVQHPALILPLQVHVLLARVQAHAHAHAQAHAQAHARAQAQASGPAQVQALPDSLSLVRAARGLLASVNAEGDKLGYARAEAWINLTRVGLALDDAALAAEAFAPLRADAGLHLDRDLLLASRVAQMEGELARLQGDLPRSVALLRQRTKFFERPGDKQVLSGWVAALDLAYSLVLQRDPGAAAALADAATRRPAGVPANHSLDTLAAWLHQQLAQPGPPGASPGASPGTAPGLGSFHGTLI